MSYRGILGVINVFLNYLPPSKITCIDLRDEWKDWFQWFKDKEIKDIQWIESDNNRYDSLRQLAVELQLPMHVVVRTISEKAGEVMYYRTSLSQENGIISPEKLQGIWKNIFTKNVEWHHSIILKDVINAAIEKQWLLVDSLSVSSILRGSHTYLQSVDLIVLRAPSLQGRVKLEETIECLTKYGFVLLDQYGTDDVGLVRMVFLKDYSKLYRSVSAQYGLLQGKYNDIQDDYQELEIQNRDFLQSKEDSDQVLNESVLLKRVNKKLCKKLKKNKRKLREVTQQYENVLQYQDPLLSLREDFLELTKKASLLLSEIGKKIEIEEKGGGYFTQLLEGNKTALCELQELNTKQDNVKSYLIKQMDNAIAQIENYIALNNYFNTGYKLSNYYGWPISADIALFIVDQMNLHEYDAVIEFGSGTSTELFAKIAERKQLGNQKKPQILSFDHLDEYYQKTQTILRQSNLLPYVDLRIAPLTSLKLEGDSYQYYDCLDYLKMFWTKLPDNPRVLVLVDGPPGTTCKYARYPAIPVIFQSIPLDYKITIDVLLDDSLRKEEKEVSVKWGKFLSSKKIEFKKEIFNHSTKGYIFIGNVKL